MIGHFRGTWDALWVVTEGPPGNESNIVERLAREVDIEYVANFVRIDGAIDRFIILLLFKFFLLGHTDLFTLACRILDHFLAFVF